MPIFGLELEPMLRLELKPLLIPMTAFEFLIKLKLVPKVKLTLLLMLLLTHWLPCLIPRPLLLIIMIMFEQVGHLL